MNALCESLISANCIVECCTVPVLQCAFSYSMLSLTCCFLLDHFEILERLFVFRRRAVHKCLVIIIRDLYILCLYS